MLCLLGEAHRVERLLPSQCGKTDEMAGMISKQTGLPTWPKLNTSIRVLYNTSAVICCIDLLTIVYIIMTMHVGIFRMNIAGGDSRG